MDDFDWAAPDYDAVLVERMRRLERLRADPSILSGLNSFYKDNPADFINDWGCTFDPRNAEIGLPTVVPFLLFPKQREFIDWLRTRWGNREDGLAEKSRDMGVSWLCVAFAVWMWKFHPGTVVGFGSRKEEYVDKIGDPKSLFWKVREFIAKLPVEFTPRGYDEKKHAPYMRIVNPENGSVIAGEAGDNIGRGARTSLYFKDESAFYDRADSIDAALSQTSNCKIDVSTPNGAGNPFYRKRHSGKYPVFTFHWRDDPRKDDAWYQDQKEKLDPVILAQEIDIDYNASTNDSFISGEIVTAAQLLGPADVVADGPWRIGVDAAHFGDDESIIHLRRGRLNLPQIPRRGVDGPVLAGIVEDQCDSLRDDVEAIIIELDGPGISCHDQLKRGRYADKVYGIHTGATLSDGRNYNVRARMWRNARDYLKEGGVSMPNDSELRTQLSSVKYSYRNGLLLMQSKKEYKSEFGRSPDRADAFVLTHAVTDPPKKRFTAPLPIAHHW